jgi:hypothetical protein
LKTEERTKNASAGDRIGFPMDDRTSILRPEHLLGDALFARMPVNTDIRALRSLVEPARRLCVQISMESLILAQDERWRRA